MSSFELEILTPEACIYTARAISALLPASDGFLEILAQHCDFAGALGQGIITLKLEDGVKKEFAIFNGLFNVLNSKLTILTDIISADEEINLSEAQQRLEALDEALSQLRSEGVTSSNLDFHIKQCEMRYAQAQVKIAPKV